MTDDISSIKNGHCESFTFMRQKIIFPYVKSIGEFVELKMPYFQNIWPLLGAYTENGRWADGLDEDLEFIGIAHYTVLKSLCYIIHNKDFIIMNDPDQRYKNVIFHFAVINDCVKEICNHILRFKKKLDTTFSKQIRKLSAIQSLDQYVSLPGYEENFRLFNIIKENEIDHLRNAFIHNPSIDIFIRWNQFWVVKPEKIKFNKTIQSINRLGRNDLINPHALIESLFCNLTEALSIVWASFYKELEIINTHKNFLKRRLN